MWQSVMNSPGNAGGLQGGVCFLVLSGLHLLLVVFFPFSPADRKGPVKEEMSLTFETYTAPAFPSDRREPPDAAPEVSAAAPEAPVQAAAPDREAPPVAAAVPEAPAPAGAAGDEAAEIPAATENAAVPGDAGSAAGNAAAGYLALIMRRLEEKKVYPFSVRKRGIEGDVTVDFTIGPNGTVAGVTLVDSDHRFLSQAAAETIRSASPFPALPARVNTIPYPVRVTIRYRLEESEAER